MTEPILAGISREGETIRLAVVNGDEDSGFIDVPLPVFQQMCRNAGLAVVDIASMRREIDAFTVALQYVSRHPARHRWGRTLFEAPPFEGEPFDERAADSLRSEE